VETNSEIVRPVAEADTEAESEAVGQNFADRRRAIAIVGALAITETVSFGVMLYGFGTFLPSLENQFGWSKLSITGALSCGLLISGLVGLLVGRHLDSHSPRTVMTAGSIAAALGVFGLSHVHSLAYFYALWSFLGLAMGATFYEPAFVVVSQWFHGRARTRALTVVTLVAGLASTIFVPLEEWLIRTRGWRSAFRFLALILAAVTVPLHAIVLRKAPPHRRNAPASLSVHSIDATDPDLGPSDAASQGLPPSLAINMTVEEAMRDPRFWALLGASFLLGLTFAALISHQVSLLIERGMTSQRAAALTGGVGLWQLGGRFVFAPLTRFFSKRFVTVLVWASQVLALLSLGFGRSSATVALFVAATGVSRGLFTLVRATSVGDIFGTANYGAISSRIALPATIAQAGGPLIASLFFRATGNYNMMVWILAGAAFLGTVLASQIHLPEKK
jgi:MFS family permease